MLADYKILLALIAASLAVIGHIPYILNTLSGINKPHIFTWLVWTILTGIAATAQFVAGAGAGAYVTAVSCVICATITIISIPHGKATIVKSDWLYFIASLLTIPLWLLTHNPLYAVILICLIDFLALMPTVRKSWHKPYEESTFMHALNIPRNFIAILSIRALTPTTWLYPATLLFMSVFMYIMLKIRRAQIQN